MKSERKRVVARLDKIFSKYICKRDGYKDVVDGSTDQPTNGHLFSRVAYSTRWDEDNCHCQSWANNYRHEFDPYPYTQWWIRKYGQEAYDKLHRKFTSVRIFKTYELLEIIETYKQKLKELENL
jgi:hypothetical protein